MKADQLSAEWRYGSGGFLSRRRGVIGLSLAAMGSMAMITLYQTGVIDHLPEPPLPGLDADKVDAAAQAYEIFDVPDGALGLSSYATTLELAAIGGEDRARDRPWLPVLLAGKVAFDVAQASKLSYDQWAKHRAFCSWCLLATGATLGMVPLVVPEAVEALDRLADRAAGDGAAALIREARDEVESLL